MFHVLLWVNLVVSVIFALVLTVGYLANRESYSKSFFVAAMVPPSVNILTSLWGLIFG